VNVWSDACGLWHDIARCSRQVIRSISDELQCLSLTSNARDGARILPALTVAEHTAMRTNTGSVSLTARQQLVSPCGRLQLRSYCLGPRPGSRHPGVAHACRGPVASSVTQRKQRSLQNVTHVAPSGGLRSSFVNVSESATVSTRRSRTCGTLGAAPRTGKATTRFSECHDPHFPLLL
jgi:hypothetical protein